MDKVLNLLIGGHKGKSQIVKDALAASAKGMEHANGVGFILRGWRDVFTATGNNDIAEEIWNLQQAWVSEIKIPMPEAKKETLP